MQSERLYEVRVRIRTLAEASKVIRVLDDAGYKDVEMGPAQGPFAPAMVAGIAEVLRGHLNKIILGALNRLGAVDREHGVEIDKIVEEMKNDADSGELVRRSPEGIVIRTVAMVSTAILAERRGWVSYDPQQTPRRFWLTEKGAEEAKRGQ